MDKKEQLEDLLDSLSPKQLEELQALLTKSSVTSRETKKKKRRGKRRRKRREAAKAREAREKLPQKPDESAAAEDFLHGIKLTKAEREQLEEASKADKAMGVHAPREQMQRPKDKTDHRVEMRCRICGKAERVSPALIPPERDRFKCNECCCRAG